MIKYWLILFLNWFDNGDNAVHLDHAHALILFDGIVVNAAGFPVVTVDGNASKAVGLDALAHPTLLTDHGLGIAQAHAVRLVQFLDKGGTHKQQTQCRNHSKEDNLPCEVGTTAGDDGGNSGADGETQEEEIA